MRKRIVIILILLVAAASGRGLAQDAPKPQRPPTPAPKPAEKPKAKAPYSPEVYDQEPDKAIEPVTMKLARGSKVGVTSKAVNVVVTGVDGDTLTATASSENGPQPVAIEVTGDKAVPKVLLYVPAARVRRVSKSVTIEVKVPRYVELETLESNRGNIQVTGMDAPVIVSNGTGNINVTRVGPLKVGSRGGNILIKEVKGSAVIRSHNGDVTIDTVAGRVDVETVNGDVSVRMADGGVWGNSAVGDLDLNCIKGRIEVNASGGSITISGAGGDVDAMAVGGDVSFRGLIRNDGTYRLKSLSGSVEMTIQADAPGFRASLSTYSGEIETAFPLKMEMPNRTEPINRKMSGTYKGGGAQITLDSFSASATLMKAAPNTLKDCKQ